jgi:membrane associated rhomboid family serine protease
MTMPGKGPSRPEREPILNAPAAVVWAIVLLLAIHAAFGFLEEGRSERLQLALVFIPARYTTSLPLYPGDPSNAYLWSFLTHQFVHADWTHVGLNAAWLLAFGGAVATRVGVLRFTLLALLSGVAGAGLFLMLNWGQLAPMAGASGAVSGLMGAAMRFYFVEPAVVPATAAPHAPVALPRMTLAETFKDGRARQFIAIWLVLNLATALIVPLVTAIPGIAWEAHLGGFLFGLFTFALFEPPGAAAAGR